MEPNVLIGYLWHAFPYTRASIRAREAPALPHWSDPPAADRSNPGGVVLLEDRDGWHSRGHNGFLILTQERRIPPIPTGWLCHALDLPDGWTGGDHRGRVTVVSRWDAGSQPDAVRLVIEVIGGEG